MESSNSDKAQAGVNSSKELLNLLTRITGQFSNLSLKKDVAYGELGKDPKQFKSNAEISFTEEDLKWLIDVSSSFRSDRIKGKEFDIEHIKKILHEHGIDSEAYFVLPDNAKDKDKKELSKFTEHIKKQDRVTYFDGAMLMTAFRNLLEQKATENISQGKKSNILGTSGEEKLCEAFKNKNNIKLWNNPQDKVTQSSDYSLFNTVVKKLSPDVKTIQKVTIYGNKEKGNISQEIKIVSKNGKSYGKPKTDVLIIIYDQDSKDHVYKISVKQPSATKGKVTVHEGSVERLLNDLKYSIPANSIFNDKGMFDKLSSALLNFQKTGSKKGMDPENLEFLNNNLADLNKWLIDYFLFGINNSYLNKNQQANALLVYNPKNGNCTINTIQEVEKKLLTKNKATFGTPFSWTYPSKKRGKKIQIKGPVNLKG